MPDGQQWGVDPASLQFANSPANNAQITMSDVRNKYPEYNDLTDTRLARGLHQKFYGDMPFAQFADKIGYVPPPPPKNEVPQMDPGELDLLHGTNAVSRIGQAGIETAGQAMQGPSMLIGPAWQESLDAAQREGGVKGRLAQLASTAGEVGTEAIRAPGAAFAGAQGAFNKATEEIGHPEIGEAAGAFLEAFPQESMGMHGVLERAPKLSAAERAAINPVPTMIVRPGAVEEPAPLSPGAGAPPVGPKSAPAQTVAPAAPFIRMEDEALAELEPEEHAGAKAAIKDLQDIAKAEGSKAFERPPPSPVGKPAPSVESMPPATFGPGANAPAELPGAASPSPVSSESATVPEAKPTRPVEPTSPVSSETGTYKAPDDIPPGEFLDYPKVIESWRQQHGPDGAMARVVAQALRDRDRGAPGTGMDPRQLSKTFQQMGDMAYGGKLAEGAYSRDRLYDAIELGVNRYIRENPERFDPAADATKAKAIAEDLTQIKDRLPTQTVRSGEKETHQQFSTPPDFAYAVVWAGNIRPGDTVLEPSAGTGSLAVHAQNAGARVIVNELSEKRREMLADLQPDAMMKEDAIHIHNTLPDTAKPSVVVMNPPFSAAPGRMGNKMQLMEGAHHIEAALNALQPGGRLVGIVGRGMTMDAPAFRDWWEKIAAQYDVRANVGVGGAVYRKYGTNFGTRLLVIDKVPGNAPPVWPRGLPVGGEVNSAADLIGKLQGVRDDRPRSAVEQVAGEPTGAPVAPQGGAAAGPRPELPSPTGVLGPGERIPGGAPEEPKPADTQQPGVVNPRPTGGRPKTGGGGRPVAPVEPKPPGTRTAGEPAGGTEAGARPGGSRTSGVGDGVRPDGSGQRDEPGVTPAPDDVIKAEAAVSQQDPAHAGINEAVFENYKPAKLNIPGAQPHPGALVQSAAMASVDPPRATHELAIDPKLVRSGALSDAQLEAVLYAGNAHADVLPNGERRGFFIGDGTGVGKGREVGGIILDNWNKGRQKALWVSEKMDLANDARRDWSGLGQNAGDIIEHGKIKAGDDIQPKRGILFTSYDTLKSSEQVKGTAKGQTRVDQIVKWLGKDFDGVIAFDEAHNMANNVAQKGDRGTKKAAQKALAGVELQRKLPNARIVYVSATGATEVSNLGYASRLGLWGGGTAFPDRPTFLNKIASAGVAGMELVARDMKALGHYISRNLSYDGVEYNRLEHRLTPDQAGNYDKLAEGWQTVLGHFEQALADTNADKNSQAKTAMRSAFWGAHQRFFNQIITSMQMPTIIKSVEQDIKAGRQAVLQLVNTMEAAQSRAIEKARAAEGPEASLEDLDMTPRDQLMQMIERSFPVNAYEEYTDDKGNVLSRPALDAAGNFIIDKEMVGRRDKLLDEIGSIKVPDGPLEMVLNHFGTDNVSEVTGRNQRVVRIKDPETGTMKTIAEKRNKASNVADTTDFQNGKKKILVFSEAGGTGRSYHDSNGNTTQARRSHYLVQPGWRADKAMQGFGRTHRTDQATAPIFHLVTTNLEGQKRFISSIARRLDQLGALTKGERRAAGQGLFTMRDNLESSEAHSALDQFFRDAHRGRIEGIDIRDLAKGMGLELVGKNGQPMNTPEMSQFLNRLLSLKIDDQNRVFGAFSERLDSVIDRAAAAGTLDTGVETYQADHLMKKAEQTVYTDPRSGAETKHVHLEAQNRNHPYSYEDVALGRYTKGERPNAWIQNNRSGRVFAVSQAGDYTDPASGTIMQQVKLTSPLDHQYADREKITAQNFSVIRDNAEAKRLWDAQVATIPEFRKSDLHVVTGAVLPIWDRLPGSPKIYRLQTDAGERMLGRVIANKALPHTLEMLGAEKTAAAAMAPTDVASRVMGGDTATLANDWKIKPSLVAGERRMELTGPDYRYYGELQRAGVFSERINYQTRYFIPTGDKAAESIAAITKGRPVKEWAGESGAGGAAEARLYSFPAALLDPQAWRRALGIPIPTAPQAMEILRDKQGLARAAAEVKIAFSPTSMRGAAPMERAIRGHTGASAQAYDIAFHALEQVRGAIDALSKQEQVDFTDRMETGQAQANPELQGVADELRRQLDTWKGKVQGLGKGYLANAIEDYMGHIWGNYHEWIAGINAQKPQTAMQSQAIGRNVAKQPIRGSGNFLKQRSYPTQLEGIQAGLIPVTYNPVDLQLIKIHEMQKFYHGTVLADQLKEKGLAVWVRQSNYRDAESNGMVKLNDRVFAPKIYGASPIGPIEPGAYYSPEPMARIFNNYMSQGWHGQSVIYDAARKANNALNSLQLGGSGFHATFVAIDATISKLALGMQQLGHVIPELAAGQFRQAGAHLARGAGNVAQGSVVGMPVAIGTTLRRGVEMRRAWLDPDNASPEMQQIVNAYKAAGGRMEMPDFFRTANAGSFYRSLSDLKHPEGALYKVAQMYRDGDPTIWGKVVKPTLGVVGRLIDTQMYPLMGALVPRMKMGVFADLAQEWLRNNPIASKAATADAMIKIQDSVDNRLGQLNYDNLFWKKTLKDTAFITTRSVGWNLGTVREIGGSLVDAGRAVRDVGQGKAPTFTNRMAYTVALPIVTAQVGALMTYMATGKGPQSMLDYFYPPSGQVNDKGEPDRRAIPGYMKDVIAFWHSPLQTARNKTSPGLETGLELLYNRDYYGGIIYDPSHDRGAPQAYADYLLNQAVPFSLRARQRLAVEGASATDQALAFWGFQPAPKSITAPERGEAFQRREERKGLRARVREPGRFDFFNAPRTP